MFLLRKKEPLEFWIHIRFFLIVVESYHKDSLTYSSSYVFIDFLYFIFSLVPFHPLSQPLDLHTWEVEYHVLFAVSRSHLLTRYFYCCALLNSSPRVCTQFSDSAVHRKSILHKTRTSLNFNFTRHNMRTITITFSSASIFAECIFTFISRVSRRIFISIHLDRHNFESFNNAKVATLCQRESNSELLH